MQRIIATAIMALGVGLGAPAWGQAGTGGTISDGDVVFVQGDSPTSATGTGPLGDMRTLGASGPDHVFQNWWWYRLDGVDAREFCLANASSGVWSGNTGTVTFDLGSFSAVLTYQVTDMGDNAGQVMTTLVVTNTSGGQLSVQVFNYQDFDLQPNLGDDRADLVSPGHIRVTDAGNVVVGGYDADSPTAYQVGAFATVRTLLSNTTVDDLGSTGLPFGPGDFTGAYQWSVQLAPDESRTFSASFSVSPPPPIGRCCLGETCTTMTQADCESMNGIYAGDATTCPIPDYTLGSCSSDFEDISGSGSPGPAVDDGGLVVPLGFSFNYFGNTYSSVGVSSNGYLTFGATLGDLSNDPIPSPAVPNDLIAGFWDDLNANPTSGGGTIVTQTLGDPGSQRFIAQWTDVPHFNSLANRHTFQIVLFEGSNSIEFRYLLLPALGGVITPSIGIENSTGTVGISIDPASVVPPACVSFLAETPENPCAAACPCNWNNDAVLNSQDFFDFLTDFFNQNADFNSDGTTNSQDFFDFLACFFAPPAGCN